MKLKALVAEFIGTFFLLFAVIGSAVVADRTLGNTGPATLLVVALAHGLAIAVGATALGHISGGHFNPAVSFGLFVGKKLEPLTMLGYWGAQAAGALLGTFTVMNTMPHDPVTSIRAGVPNLHLNTDVTQGIILEGIGTFFLVLVVFGTAVDRRAPRLGALLIGLTITAMILTFGPLTGGSINPARWLGPAVMTSGMSEAVVYLVGPLVGGALAALVYVYVLTDRGDLEESVEF